MMNIELCVNLICQRQRVNEIINSYLDNYIININSSFYYRVSITIKEQLASMEAKLDHMHKDLTKNKGDIEVLKAKMNMGAGGIKALALFGSILIALTIFVTKLLGIK